MPRMPGWKNEWPDITCSHSISWMHCFVFCYILYYRQCPLMKMRCYFFQILWKIKRIRSLKKEWIITEVLSYFWCRKWIERDEINQKWMCEWIGVEKCDWKWAGAYFAQQSDRRIKKGKGRGGWGGQDRTSRWSLVMFSKVVSATRNRSHFPRDGEGRG